MARPRMVSPAMPVVAARTVPAVMPPVRPIITMVRPIHVGRADADAAGAPPAGTITPAVPPARTPRRGIATAVDHGVGIAIRRLPAVVTAAGIGVVAISRLQCATTQQQ